MPATASEATAFVLTRSAQFSLFSSCKSRPLGKGGLAQLVERLLCKQNVNGSNPLTSTIFQDPSRASRGNPQGQTGIGKLIGPVAQLVRAPP